MSVPRDQLDSLPQQVYPPAKGLFHRTFGTPFLHVFQPAVARKIEEEQNVLVKQTNALLQAHHHTYPAMEEKLRERIRQGEMQLAKTEAERAEVELKYNVAKAELAKIVDDNLGTTPRVPTASQLAWKVAGLIPKIGPYISMFNYGWATIDGAKAQGRATAAQTKLEKLDTQLQEQQIDLFVDTQLHAEHLAKMQANHTCIKSVLHANSQLRKNEETS